MSSSVLPKSFLAALALSATMAAANVGAAVIDFESLRHSDSSPRYVQSYAEDGFLLTSNIDPLFADQAFAVWGDTDENFNGSTALFNTFIGNATSLTLEAAGGDSFDLASIDLGPLANGGLGGQVTFEGLTAGGSAVSQTVTFGPTLAPTTVAFGPAFIDLVSVSWVQGFSAHQFDNIVIVSDVVPTPVPEPAAWLGLVAGLVLLGVARRPRR